MVRNKVARPASIPTIHTVVLVITWLIEAAASWCPAARPGTARPAGRPGGSGGMSLIAGCLLLRERVVRCGAGAGPHLLPGASRRRDVSGAAAARPRAARPMECTGGRETPH